MLIRNLKATGDCGVPIGVLGAFKGLTQPAFVVWPVEAELNSGRQSDEVTVVNAGLSPCSDNAPRYGWPEGISVKTVISGGQLILRRIMLVPIPRFV
jgi:hypothetical protein